MATLARWQETLAPRSWLPLVLRDCKPGLSISASSYSSCPAFHLWRQSNRLFASHARAVPVPSTHPVAVRSFGKLNHSYPTHPRKPNSYPHPSRAHIQTHRAKLLRPTPRIRRRYQSHQLRPQIALYLSLTGYPRCRLAPCQSRGLMQSRVLGASRHPRMWSVPRRCLCRAEGGLRLPAPRPCLREMGAMCHRLELPPPGPSSSRRWGQKALGMR